MNCIICGAPEVNPATGLLNVRALKINMDGAWWSHSLCCSAWFSTKGEIDPCDKDCYCQEKSDEN